ncbi:MAG: HAMP domain-containing histidine kinase [Ruminococcaceae bacterium]|nr:HAMP domain-containing histidine kinase [Oscillospiraceae bacterium]
MKEYSQEELRLLTEVLPNVAQELRGAMANIYIATNKLVPMQEREQDETVDKYASAFMQSYYRMYRVIGNMTDARMLAETGRFRELANDDIVGVVRGVCERAEALFEAEGVVLDFESDKSSQIIAMDAGLIERLLLNLLSNALKFTPRGGAVSVRVRTTARYVYLSVSDTGCGIPAEKLEHVFDRFLEAEHADPAPHGMGLGLALCRRIAQGHGGTIVAESEEGIGSTFTASLRNESAVNMALHDVRAEYAGGFNQTLVELSDALGMASFSYRHLD